MQLNKSYKIDKCTLILDNMIKRYPNLKKCYSQILDAFHLLVLCYADKKKLLIVGNGGSASDSEHIMGELMKSFVLPRSIPSALKEKIIDVDRKSGEYLIEKLEMPLRAISLVSDTSLNTAYINDVDANTVYAQKILGLGNEGDILLAISTSGNSKNIYYACVVAKALQIKIIALTGCTGGLLKSIADVSILAPEYETYLIQELHLPIYHCLCKMVENYFFGFEQTELV